MNYFQKKQWIRLVCCVAILLAVSLALCGVFGGGHLLYKQQSAKEVTVKGFGDGDVKVSVGAGEDGTVESLKIDASTQTEGLGARASEEAFTSQFIGKKGPFVYGENGVEAISGATVTSNAVIGAINEALGVEAPAPEAAPAAEESPKEPAPAAEKTAETPAGGEAAESVSAEALRGIIASMGMGKENSYVTDYLEQDPYLVNIYEGYGFAKDYGSARDHVYTLEDVSKTQRPHPKANCITCKTPDMHKMIAEQGVAVYSMPFDEVMAQMTQPVSCYTCHGADDGNNGLMVVTHQYVNEALGANVSQVKPAALSCGQCHIEYYFTPEDSEAMMPYHSVEEMTPEAILAYYDGMGFADWEQPGTGTKMLKAQHPELENYSYGKHASLLSCADCHMERMTTESGEEYLGHRLMSPLESETILGRCAQCHGSAEATVTLVKDIQAKTTARETEIGNRLSALKDAIALAVANETVTGDDLEVLRKLHREAQWFFDYCYVENSEGAHNSALSERCLDTAEQKISEAWEILGKAGVKEVA